MSRIVIFTKKFILNILYLRVPPRHTASWPHGALSYAISSPEGAVIREGSDTLSALASFIPKSQVVIIVAAPDVTLLELTLPPMPEAKLKLALPNLVEDQIMSASAECVLMLGAKSTNNPNRRSVAVVQRSWLQQLSGSLFALGASQIRALPAQLCLSLKKDHCSAALEEYPDNLVLTLRSAGESGIGMILNNESSAQDCLATIAMLAPDGPVALQLSSQRQNEYKAAIKTNPGWEERIVIQEASWSSTVQAARNAGFNLMPGLNSAHANRIQWRIWRLPLVMAALLLLINTVALNYDYWTMKREAEGLRTGMLQTYRAAFPKETVIVAPLEQMRKHLDTARRGSGQPSPDDFTLLLTQFGTAWSAVTADKLPKLISIDYKDHALVLQIKGPMPQKELQAKLDDQGLVLKKNNSEIWQVKNPK